MKIVQTFWHGNNSLLDNSFGWMNPQYHLMSWALSCLSLKDNYQNIVLYTDSHGYEIFAEQLKLPYTDIIIQYDNLTCPEPHWAYPKLLTYSLQKEPPLPATDLRSMPTATCICLKPSCSLTWM